MFVLMLSVCSVYKKINILMSFLNIEDTTKLYCKKKYKYFKVQYAWYVRRVHGKNNYMHRSNVSS